MKIKVCGLVQSENLQEVKMLQPDYLGFIFYQNSARYMKETLLPPDLMHGKGKKTGVFVNSSIEEIISISLEYQLDTIQLHGNQSPEFCFRLKEFDLEILKAFRLDRDFDFKKINDFKSCCDLFLFDTKGEKEGGNGFSFDWNLLNNYDQEIPFFLSGGMGPENISKISSLQKMNLYGIDLNSKIEFSPGIKDIKKLEKAIELIKELNLKRQ